MSLTNQGRQIKCYVAYRVRDCCYSRRRYCLVVGVVADVFFFFFCTWGVPGTQQNPAQPGIHRWFLFLISTLVYTADIA